MHGLNIVDAEAWKFLAFVPATSGWKRVFIH